MSTYAAKTQVSPEKSRAELETILRRYGADAFAYGYEDRRAVVTFKAAGRIVRFEIDVPQAEKFRMGPGYRVRTPVQQRNARDQAERQIWRALVLVVKAKLEAVESGLVGFEQEFMAHIVLPSGETVGQWMEPQLAEVYETGEMPSLLPGTRKELTA